MAINILYLHSQHYNWSDKTISLLDNQNFNNAINSNNLIDYHSSIEDLGLQKALEAIDLSNEIIVIDLDLNFPDMQGYQYGRIYNQLSYKDKVKGFNFINDICLDNLNLFPSRNSNKSMLWLYGCSITYGVGVSPAERYGTLLSNSLEKKLVDQSKPGSSIRFMSNKILCSDLKPGDSVVWGLTNLCRFEYADDWKLKTGTITSFDEIEVLNQNINIEFFDSLSHILPSIYCIAEVINYCKKIGVTLYLVNLFDNTWLPMVLKKVKNFIDLSSNIEYNGSTKFIDYGTDNQHPGPEQHKYYAEQIYKLMKGNTHGKTI